jgi:hypothetical protein
MYRTSVLGRINKSVQSRKGRLNLSNTFFSRPGNAGTLFNRVRCVPRTDVPGCTFTPSLRDSEVVSGTLRERQIVGNLYRSSSTETTAFRLANRSSMESANFILRQPAFPVIWSALIGLRPCLQCRLTRVWACLLQEVKLLSELEVSGKRDFR